ncbi:hypothetical protein NVSP9465_01539 [Novosphingobium sp. CECT 9465]|nr:hypothetical protein NVSP9465_01539 [Novosphingobium sp. CECT 9465]
MHLRHSRFAQGDDAGICRRTTGHHIVDQQDVCVLQRSQPSRMWGDCAGQRARAPFGSIRPVTASACAVPARRRQASVRWRGRFHRRATPTGCNPAKECAIGAAEPAPPANRHPAREDAERSCAPSSAQARFAAHASAPAPARATYRYRALPQRCRNGAEALPCTARTPVPHRDHTPHPVGAGTRCSMCPMGPPAFPSNQGTSRHAVPRAHRTADSVEGTRSPGSA